MNNQILKAACSLMLMRRTPIPGVRGAFLYSSDTGTLQREGMRLEGLSVAGSRQFRIWDKGVAANNTLNETASVIVYAGGLFTGGILKDSTTAIIEPGGEIADTQITSAIACVINVYGGVATGITIDGRFSNKDVINVYSGGVANDCVFFRGKMVVKNGGEANDCILVGSDWAEINVEGVTNGTIISYGRTKSNILAGGVANHSYFFGGLNFVLAGGTSNFATVKSGGLLRVYGEANYATIEKGGRIYVYSGGKALNLFKKTGGQVDVEAGATVTYRSQE